MTMPMPPVQSGPNDKEQAMVGLNHALLNAFHNLYLGKKRQVPASLEHLQGGLPPGLEGRPLPPGLQNRPLPTGLEMQMHNSPTGSPDISQPPPVAAPPMQLGRPKQNIPLTAIAARIMGRRG